MTSQELQRRLRSLGNPADAAFLARFFKTGPGDYGEGDVFLGVRVPVIRRVAREFRSLSLPELESLLQIHKAAGWMLREVGKRDLPALVEFLAAYHRVMPRTMLRYAIERFPEKQRRGYLKG